MSFDSKRALNKEIMKFSENDKRSEHPKAHIGLNSLYLTIREEIAAVKPDMNRERRTRLYQLFVQDYLTYDEELRQVDRAFIETQY